MLPKCLPNTFRHKRNYLKRIIIKLFIFQKKNLFEIKLEKNLSSITDIVIKKLIDVINIYFFFSIFKIKKNIKVYIEPSLAYALAGRALISSVPIKIFPSWYSKNTITIYKIYINSTVILLNIWRALEIIKLICFLEICLVVLSMFKWITI